MKIFHFFGVKISRYKKINEMNKIKIKLLDLDIDFDIIITILS